MAWQRETITDIFYMVESDSTGDFYLTYMRYYPEFEDPIVYEVKDIPLTKEPTYMQYFEDSLIVQYDTANEVEQYLLCDFDEYIDIEENVCKACGKYRFSWDPMSTSSSCIRCTELENKWDTNQMTKYLAATICYDIANDLVDDNTTTGECGAICEQPLWVYGVAGVAFTALIFLLCSITVAKAPRKRLSQEREAAEILLLVI